MNFEAWLKEVTKELPRSEWADKPEWARWYELGLTPKEALKQFWKLLEAEPPAPPG